MKSKPLNECTCEHCLTAYEEGVSYGYDIGWADAMKEKEQVKK